MKTRMLSARKYLGHPVVLLFFYLLTAGIVLYMIDYFPKHDIERLLISAVPWALTANLLLIFIGVVFCRQDIAEFFRGLGGPIFKKLNYRGALLVLVIAFAFIMASFVSPRTHRIYFDEDIYANIGQNIALTGQAAVCNYGEFVHGEYQPNWLSYNKEPNGWPYLISLVFQIFGVGELQVFFLNNLLLAAGVGLAFAVTWVMTGAFFPAFIAALILAFTPHNLIWSNTMAAEPAAAVFTLASMLCLMIYLKTNEWRHLYLLAVMLPFASQMRPESLLILPLALLAVALVRPGIMLRRQFWGAGLITAVFLLPQALHLYAESGESWGASGAKFSLEYLRNNLAVNGMYYLNNKAFPVLVTIFSLVGLLFAKYSGKHKVIIASWFLIFWGIFLFFYAGSYQYGADVRFAVLSFAPLAILAALGMDWIKNKLLPPAESRNAAIILMILLLVSWIQFLPLVRLVGQEAWAARADHAFIVDVVKKIPQRSIVISHIPTMLLLQGQNAVTVHGSLNDETLMRGLMNRFDGGVYFHHNYWCEASEDANNKACVEIKQKYRLEEFAADRTSGRLYGLYRIRMNDAGKK